MRRLRSISVVLVSIAAGGARAQMPSPRETIDSLDATVVGARDVAVGRVVDYAPAPANSAYGPRDVTIAVDRAIKGAPGSTLHVQLTDPVASLESWKAASSRLLVAVPPPSPRRQRAIDLDDPQLMVSTEEFAILRDPERVVRYAMKVARRTGSADLPERVAIDPPQDEVGARWRAAFGYHGAGGLVLPADAALERHARSLLGTKELESRLEGVRELRFFKSKANVGPLNRLLDDPGFRVLTPPGYARGVESRTYPVREAAYHLLTDWGERVPAPTMRESVSLLSTIETLAVDVFDTGKDDLSWLDGAKALRSLDLSCRRDLTDAELAAIGRRTGLTHLALNGGDVDDARLGFLSGLRELRTLSLDGNPILDEGTRTIASLPKLEDVSLARTEVTDAGLDALRRSRPALKVLPEQAQSPIDDYVARNDRAGVERMLGSMPGVVNDPSVAPLHVAAYERNDALARLLLDRGAAVNGLDAAGRTPLQAATVYVRPNLSLIQLLLDRGAEVNRTDKEGLTPLDQALNGSNFKLARLLLACGADPDLGKGVSTYARPDPRVTALVTRLRTARRHPLPMLEPTDAVCRRSAYTLNASRLKDWSTKPIGRLTGPLQWSRTPSGRGFLGPFGGQSVTLHLTDLPRHGNVRVELDLFVIGSWDGNGGLGEGPDLIDVRIPGVGVALHSTFFNNTEGDAAGLPMQSFPDVYPDGFHPGYTGAAEVRSLGFTETWHGQPFARDAVYRLGWTFAHEGPDLTVVLSGLTVPQDDAMTLGDDERWGIGGLRVLTD